MNYLGIEIGGTKLQLVVGSAQGVVLARERRMVAQDRGGVGIREQIAEALPVLISLHRPGRIGVGFGGPINWRTGRVECSHQILGWAEFPLAEWLHQQTGLPVTADNDANVAALGEAKCGAGRGSDPVFYLTMGSGAGGGLVVGGSLYHGAVPGEAEIGHLRLDRSGTRFEDRCSGWAVDRRLREAVKLTVNSVLADRLRAAGQAGGEARELAPALAAGCPVARRVLGEVVDDLCYGLSHVVHLFHPEIILLGGGLALVGEPLRQAVAQRLPNYVMDSFQPGPRIALAGLGEEAVPVGALVLAASEAGP